MNLNCTSPYTKPIKVLSCRGGYVVVWLILLAACNHPKPPPEKQLTHSTKELQQKTGRLIKDLLDFARRNNGKIDDTLFLNSTGLVKKIYESKGNIPLWSQKGLWNPEGDSLFYLISRAKYSGLFPEDYHFLPLVTIRNILEGDTGRQSERLDAALWGRADLLLTDAFLRWVHDLKLGRLPQDSITLRSDSVLTDDFYRQQIEKIFYNGSWTEMIGKLEPKHRGYHELKEAIPKFMENAGKRVFTRVPQVSDTGFRQALQRRLFEGGYIGFDSTQADSVQLAASIRKFQKESGINVDGKAGEVTLRVLNTTDEDRFIRIAITLDRYKMLPEKMPDRYLWVNLPGFYLQLVEYDTTRLISRIICGKKITRSPVLTSSISELITYPQWTIPLSIIIKEILPAAKRNPGYIRKKGYSILDTKGNEVNPDSVKWAKYKRSFPWRIIQGSGDDNALGVMKFNFHNKYAIYLHDTNQRSLFISDNRAMSHGCIRVQQWEELAFHIIRGEGPGSVAKEDSVKKWLMQKQKRSIPVSNRLPLFIRYFSCESKNGELLFYDDVYGEDKIMQEKYFAGKKVF